MSQQPDWSNNVGDLDRDDPPRYGSYDKVVGEIALGVLGDLCVDLTDVSADGRGWTRSDYGAVSGLAELDHLDSLLVPPATTPLDNRVRYRDLKARLWPALPFAEAERHWLFRGDNSDLSQEVFGGVITLGGLEKVRASEGKLVSEGMTRVIHGRDLMRRWWLWRRELGVYSDGAALKQTRESLAGITSLLTPELGLPASYEALNGHES